MIMLNPNQGRVTTIVASIKKKKGLDGGRQPQSQSDQPREELREREGPETDSEVAKSSAMDSFLAAVDKKDSRAMVRAMTTFMDLCADYGDDENEEKSGGSEPYNYQD